LEKDVRLETLVALAQQAGQAIMAIYDSLTPDQVFGKEDGSPLTLADLAAHKVICAGLAALTPDIPVVSEESDAKPDVTGCRSFWLVDPLDGTREFIKHNGEFTVNIGLIVDGAPELGVVSAPALGKTWCGQVGVGAWCIAADGVWRPIQVTRPAATPLRVVASRSHSDERTQAFLDKLPAYEVVSAGSSLKFCLVAEGQADLYPRLGTTMEWDTAAAHCVLEAAGGEMRSIDGGRFGYAKPEWRNPHFIAAGYTFVPSGKESVGARLTQ